MAMVDEPYFRTQKRSLRSAHQSGRLIAHTRPTLLHYSTP